MSEQAYPPAVPPVPFDKMLGAVLDRMAEEKEQQVDATPTPWPTWNAACRSAGGGVGIARGWHVVVGARSGAGKSLLGAALAARAIQSGERVAFLSLEMSQIEMQTRIMAIVARADVRRLEHGESFDRAEWSRAAAVMRDIYQQHGGVLLINRTTFPSLRSILDSIRHLVAHHEVGYILVDYMQLAAMSGGRATDLLDRVTEVSYHVRGLAKELGITTIGMSQLNRESSKAPETPRKEGLMGGSPLENDADQVILLDHSRIVRDPATKAILSYAVLDKNRHGPVAEIPTYLSTTTLEMIERLPDELEHEVPSRLRVVS